MAIACTLIPGDGIGPDITDATLAVLEAAGATFDWDRQVAGAAGVAQKGNPMPDETLESIKRTRLALKGPLETPSGVRRVHSPSLLRSHRFMLSAKQRSRVSVRSPRSASSRIGVSSSTRVSRLRGMRSAEPM